jgi:hypothetical protein
LQNILLIIMLQQPQVAFHLRTRKNNYLPTVLGKAGISA